MAETRQGAMAETGGNDINIADTDGNGRRGGDGELLNGSVLHAGVDRNHRHVTLQVALLLKLEQDEDHLVSKADDRYDSKDIRPYFRLVFDRSRCVAPHCVFHHDQKDNVEYGQHTCQGMIEGNASEYTKDDIRLTLLPAIDTYCRKSIVLE